MRIRKPFAGAFAGLVVFAGYIGLAPIVVEPSFRHGDKVLHFFTFFLFTILFYWIFETSRRRATHITLMICTASMAVGSEILQGAIPNDRVFDYLDIVANVIGSLAGLGLCSAYHRRMLERKRAAKGYATISDMERDDIGPEDVELGTGTGPQESGVVVPPGAGKSANLDEELENWDENVADNWDDDEAPANGNGTAHITEVDTKKRED